MSMLCNSINRRPIKISGFDPTPLWNHVHVISTSTGGGNRVWTCNYCNKKVTGSYSKVKGHLLKLSGHGVEACKLISEEEYFQVKNEYDEAEANKAKEAYNRQRKKECIIPYPESFDLVHCKRRRGIEVSDLGERSQSSRIVENVLAVPESEPYFHDVVKGKKYQAVEEDSPVETRPRKMKIIKKLTPGNNVPIWCSGRKFDSEFDEDYRKVEPEEEDEYEGNNKERGDQEETIIEMCPKVYKTSPGILASRAPTAEELLERRILKKTTGGNTSVYMLPTKAEAANVEASKPLVNGKRNFQIKINSNFCDFKEGTSSIKPDLDQFYFPAAKEYLSKLRAVDVLAESAANNIQSLQGILAVKEHIEDLESKLEVAKVTEKIYREKSEEDDKTISLLRKHIKRLEAYGKKKKDEVLDCAGYYTFKTKAELMKDFLDGNTAKWEPEKDIQIWEDNFSEMTPPGADFDFDSYGEEDKINSSNKPSDPLERPHQDK